MTDDKWMRWMAVGDCLGCHQMPERSFFWNGYQFPVCARCTGVILSGIPAVIVFIKTRIPLKVCVAMSGVMFLDWFLQYMEIRESTNKRRLITGLIGGFGYTTIHLYLYRALWRAITYRIKREEGETI